MNVEQYLHTCRELSALCTQNGWIDNDTLEVEILERNARSVLASVTFEEIIVKAAGCVGRRMPCHGRVRLHLSASGDVEAMEFA